jgi:hypothetical protein
MEVTIDKNELYGLIKKAVREVLHEERFEFFFERHTFCVRRGDERYRKSLW